MLPNNPTGTRVADRGLRELLAGTAAVVLLDEAYADFADGDARSCSTSSTTSSSSGRCRRPTGSPGSRRVRARRPRDVAGHHASRGPYKVGALAEAVALAVLREDRDWVRDRVGRCEVCERGASGALADAGFEVLESSANFVAFLVEDATAVLERLLDAGCPGPRLPLPRRLR